MNGLHIIAPRFDAPATGAGSRGGHVVGRTKKGNPIYGAPASQVPRKPDEPKKSSSSQASQEKFEKLLATKSSADQAAFKEIRERGLRIPPAWTSVWVNPERSAGLQVKGRDSKGRTQYVYSAKAQAASQTKKFNRLRSFSRELPGITAKISRDLGSKEEAAVLHLISKTGFRIGSNVDTKADKQAFGASTLRTEHVSKVTGSEVHFEFTGKKGVPQSHVIRDPQTVAIIKKRLDAGASGALFNTSPEKVRGYLKSISKKDFKVKDFRTHVATSTAIELVKGITPPRTIRERVAKVMEVAKVVSQRLGNTPVMARDAYIDPVVFRDWEVTG